MYKVLGRKTSGNVQKVVWLLEELGLSYERLDYGRQFGNTSDPGYLRLNPNGKVPTLVDGETVVWESNTILRYIANQTSAQSFYLHDPALRSMVERWMDWQLSALNGPYLVIFKAAKKPVAERPETWNDDIKTLDEQLRILDGCLPSQGWLVAENMTLAELALGPIVARCLEFPIDLSPLSNVRSWCSRIASRPAFVKATRT